MDYKNIILEKQEGIATITLNRPQKLNAFTMEMVQELIDAAEDSANDKQVKVIILTGAGRGFCSGRDFSGEEALKPNAMSLSAVDGLEKIGVLVTKIRKMPKPWIAMINGPAIGPGLGFATACDILMASEEAVFGFGFARMGLHPECGMTYIVPRLVGLSSAFELMLTSKTINAKEAEKIGLVNHIFPPAGLLNATRELATTLAKGPSVALGLTKLSLNHACDQGLAEALEMEARALGICVITEDHQEAGKAFREKRPPVFQGK